MTVLTQMRPDKTPAAGTSDAYAAFLSYCHADEKTADRVHRRLERFKVPPELIGKDRGEGVIPRRLRPVFRDRHELAAARDLGAEIEEALAESRVLIVLCSPAAATSRWVNSEIERYHRVRPAGQVLAAIVAGEPYAADLPGREAEECFPPALKVQYDERGLPTTRRAEPIAADLREGKDGQRIGFLKIVAGMLGVGLDELVKRDAARRHRRMVVITSASIVGMSLTSGLALFAFEKRDEARDQRRQAEGLVGFMIGDLRTKLEPMGRLDVLDAVGERALGYYRKQDKVSLSDDSLAQRARALTMIGEIAAKRGQLDAALARYQEALAGTAEALRRAPDDPQRLFDHAQSVYWVGSVAFDRGQLDEAVARFQEYHELAARLIAADPSNPKWRLEGIYAATNLGSVELQQRRYAAAARTFGTALQAVDTMVGKAPGNAEYRKLRLESLAFESDALDRSGLIELAIAARERQLALLAPELANGRADQEYWRKAQIANIALARLRFQRGDTAKALAFAADGSAIGERLIAIDPSNADWRASSAAARVYQAMILVRIGREDAARDAATQSCGAIEKLVRSDPSVAVWEQTAQRCLALRAELAVVSGDAASALLLARSLVDRVARHAAEPNSNPFGPGEARKLVGDMRWRSGDRATAESEWRVALAQWPQATAETPIQRGERGEMLRGLGDVEDARTIERQLRALGYRRSISDRAKLNRN